MIKILALLLVLIMGQCSADDKCVMYWIDENKTQYIKLCSNHKFILFDCISKIEKELPVDDEKVKWLINTKKFKEDFPDFKVSK